MTDLIRVLIADDHAATRAGIRASLQADGFQVCAEVSTAGEALTAAVEQHPDVTLLDIYMPGSGITAARQISRQVPQTAVVMLTYSRTDEDLFNAIRAGARGYLVKDLDPERLGPTLRVVLRGEAALPPNLMARVLDEFRRQRRRRVLHRGARATALSSREWQVMEQLSEGASTDEAAQRLGLSPSTVRVHVSSVLKKLQVADRAAAVEFLTEE